jgi:hypothetical protein
MNLFFLLCVALPFYHLVFEVWEIFMFARCDRGASLSCNFLAGMFSACLIMFIFLF